MTMRSNYYQSDYDIPAPIFDPAYVYSRNGIAKRRCVATCCDPYCAGAHPNNAGSIISHPKWCLEGTVTNCRKPACPFNHFRTMREFVNYRAGDLAWAQANYHLVKNINSLDC